MLEALKINEIKYYQIHLDVLNADEKENAFAIEDALKKINECKIGKLETADPKRVFVDNLGSNINSSYPEYSAFISADESMMILTARRENSTGGKLDEMDGWPFEDLYQSFKVNGKWTAAQNFGPIVNTDDHDASSGLSGDGATMFIFKYTEKDGGDIYTSNLKGNTCTKNYYLLNILKSVLLFSCLPSSVSLVATGAVSPYPLATHLSVKIPLPIK